LDDKSLKKTPRIPDTVNGIQVNFCKNPICLNFGRPASINTQSRGRFVHSQSRDTYKLSGERNNKVNIECSLCGETPPLKSNLAISEELDRLSAYLTHKTPTTCPIELCLNHTVAISTPKAYYSFGKTKSGSKRYRCRECGTTFAIGCATLRQKKPEVNEIVFKLLVNKMPFNRIMEVAGIYGPALYGKIDFIHKQCLAFVAGHERRLTDLPIKRLYLSVDRQDHMINWKVADDKRNIVLTAIGCADNVSGYVFGIHTNYDPHIDAMQAEADSLDIGDDALRAPFRKYARVWRQQDYKDAIAGSNRKRANRKRLRDSIQDVYDVANDREDVEVAEAPDIDIGLPYAGMQVHSEYTMYAHFFLLKRLFGTVGKIRFFLDQDSGIRAACLSTFWQEVLEKRCDAFYVRINKGLTINQKRALKAQSDRDLADFRATSAAYADLTDHDLRHIVIKYRLDNLVDIGKWHDRWLFYPFPDMSEPEKAICWLTDLHDRAYDADHLASLYSKATLHGIDRFFMQVRRRLSLLERPIATASSEGRIWHGYSAYNPAMIGKLLDIFRVFYNFCEMGDDKKTPAMRLGLSKIVSYRDILGG
jgi:transposase-like protein